MEHTRLRCLANDDGVPLGLLLLHVMLVVEMEAPDGKNKSHSVMEPRKRLDTSGAKSKPGEERLL